VQALTSSADLSYAPAVCDIENGLNGHVIWQLPVPPWVPFTCIHVLVQYYWLFQNGQYYNIAVNVLEAATVKINTSTKGICGEAGGGKTRPVEVFGIVAFCFPSGFVTRRLQLVPIFRI